MKKTYLALVFAFFTLAGCQNEQDKKAEVNQLPSNTLGSAEPATPIKHLQVITTDTFADPAHSARHSLDWSGIYIGALPCADCSAIQTSLAIDKDGYYLLKQVYEGKDVGTLSSHGRFTWNKLGNTITLDNEPAPNQYFVAENRLIKLDRNGAKITGALASFYNLKKVTDE
ncbi:hypothetical protein BS333_19785 [Vibrio azureus]|uniref:Lipoprotein NlpE n=1 Tax=Vibrio azureus NBRC 104587 TaxID=1219077 RepID=U3AUT6_9VIBR|nr:copper resistance protein NlpE [Vibrio azureus]AUI88551.1 hypothetical protein BS333_19785 [Vibrio azureus]GAD77012.1 hypothetical protein VAZ01S_058_00020 [Vibrio azureus NBRC 104587]